jgi:hypothetical protein
MLNFANFGSCHEKWMKVGQISSKTLTKVHSIYLKFSQSFTFSFNEILFRFILLMTEIFRFNCNSQLPIRGGKMSVILLLLYQKKLYQCKYSFLKMLLIIVSSHFSRFIVLTTKISSSI